MVILRHAANLPSFEESFHVPNLKNPDAYALEILSEVLADGKSSRLYKDLVEDKRMVVGTSAGSNIAVLRSAAVHLLGADAARGEDR